MVGRTDGGRGIIIRDAPDPLFLDPAGSGSRRILNLRIRPEPDPLRMKYSNERFLTKDIWYSRTSLE